MYKIKVEFGKLLGELPLEAVGLLLVSLNKTPGVLRVQLVTGKPAGMTGKPAGSTGDSPSLTGDSQIHDKFLKIRRSPTGVPCSAAYSTAGSKTPGLTTGPTSYPPDIARQ